MKAFPVIKKIKPTLTVVSTIMIGFIISDITIVLAQPSDTTNQDNSMTPISIPVKSDTDGEQTIVTLLRSNETSFMDNSPIISIQDFRNTFDPLLEQLILSNNYK
ncbi:MAG: hypothetical protein WBX01_02965 [Nitrososphaeraceae archaeon]